jgi:ABC-type transport system involved in multi-copper enzyme maturation permease subunit
MTDGILTGLRLRDLGIVASTWLRFAMRSGGGVISLFIVVVIGLFLTSFVIDRAQAILVPGKSAAATATRSTAEREDAANKIDAMVGAILTGVLPEGPDTKEDIAFLTKERPAVFSGVLIFLLYLIPFAACSAAFNQTASDIGSRGLRFLLSRTERPNIFVGRFLSAACFLGLALAFLIAVVTLYVALRFPIYGVGEMALAGLEGWAQLWIFSLPFIALCSWISSTQRSPFAALAVCYAVAILPWWLLALAASSLGALDIDWGWLEMLTPWDWRHGLMSASGLTRLKCHGAMFGFTAIFLVLGLINFRKRDL